MHKQILLENSLVVFIFLIIASILNLLLPVHFMSLLLIGIVYKIFTKNLEKENYYLFSSMILVFCIIELSQGLKLFSLSLLAFFIHIFISPRLKFFIASEKLYSIFSIFIFYIGVFGLFHILDNTTFSLFAILFINCIIDVILILILLWG